MACSPKKLERQSNGGSAESLKLLNRDLRNHLAILRTQLDSQKGSIKQAQWQKVLNVRSVREYEQQKCAQALESLRIKLESEKIREIESMKVTLQLKFDNDMLKLSRQKDVETTKLKQDLNLKERMLQKLFGENRRGSLNLHIFAKRTKLINELSELRVSKKELEETLEQANEAERIYGFHLKKTAATWEAEVQKVRRDAHFEIKSLIEQLKNKDKIISHLEKELGQQAGYAVSLQLDRNHQNKMSAATAISTDRQLSFSSPLKHNQTLKSFSVHSSSFCENRSEECSELESESTDSDNIHDTQVVKRIHVLEERQKTLIERNRKFLQEKIELTKEIRNLEDQISSLTNDQEKLKEQAEHSKTSAANLARLLSQETSRSVSLETQLIECEKLKQESAQKNQLIKSLKKECEYKERRLDLIVNHKRQKRLRRSKKRCCNFKETSLGNDEDDRSFSSSENSRDYYGTMSDDLWEELSREQREQLYERLMMEHLQLKRCHALLKKHTNHGADPLKSEKIRCDLEDQLIVAQLRIGELEEMFKTNGKEEICELLNEKDKLQKRIETLETQDGLGDLLKEKDKLLNLVETLKYEKKELVVYRVQLEDELKEAKEQVDDMEFQILEFQEETKKDEVSEALLLQEKLNLSLKAEKEAKMENEELHHELSLAIDGKGREVDAIFKKLDNLKNAKDQIRALEITARELQAKVICLQQEKDALKEQLSKKDSTQLPREAVINEVPDLTQLEMLNLKDQISAQKILEQELMKQNTEFQERIAEFERCYKTQNKQIADLEKLVQTYKKNISASKLSPSNQSHHSSMPVPAKRKTKSLGNQTDFIIQPNSFDELKNLEQQLQRMYEENLHLKQKLQRKPLDYDSDKSSDDERESRIGELESVLEKLKEKSYSAELSERQIKEKLKLAEQTINDVEASEVLLRENYDQLKNRDSQTEKQIHELHRSLEEMNEIIQDKDIIESALEEKVEFLEKVESASNQKIAELQSSEKYLQGQLNALEQQQTNPHIVVELKGQVGALTAENKALVNRVAELEEDEEILRENWRKVAAEDAKRAQQQFEKVQLLELLNRELKIKLHDSQESAALTLFNCSSIAMELSESQGTTDLADQPTEVSDLKLKIRHLEDELLEVTEIKNNKIELLQERIEKFRENEIKLSETLMESETTEAELKSKLAFYESSKVTVEKILDYEDKLHELRSSQEDLLQQLHSLEDHEEDLQEKLDRTEKEHKSKLSRLEKEISNYKEREKSSTTKVRTLEKHEEELMEKVTKFSICEKRFQDKFESQESEIAELKQKIEDKKEKIRELDATKTVMFDQISKLMDNEKQLNERISELEKLVENSKKPKSERMLTRTNSQSQESLSQDSENRDEQVFSLEKENATLALQLESVISQSSEKITQLESDLSEAKHLEKEFSEKMSASEKLLSGSRSDVLETESRVEELITVETKLRENIQYLEDTIVISLKEEVKDLKSINSGLTDKLQEASMNNTSEQQEALDSLQKELLSEQKKITVLSENNARLVEDLAETQNSSEKIAENLVTLEKQNNELITQRNETEMKLQKTQQEILGLQQKIEILLDAETKLMNRVEEQETVEIKLTNELSDIKSKLDNQPEVLKKEQTSIEYAQKGSMGASFDSSENEITGSMKLSSLYQRVQALEADKEELSNKLVESHSVESVVREMKEKTRLLEESEDRLMDRIMELEESEERMKNELSRQNENLDLESFRSREVDLQKGVEKLQFEKDSLENELQIIEDQLHESEEKGTKQLEKLKNLERSYSETTETVDRLEHTNGELKSRLTLSEDKLQQEKTKCHHFEAKIKNLLKDAAVVNERMKQEKDRDHDLINSLQNEVSDLKVDRISFESRLQEMVEEIREEKTQSESKLREQRFNFDNLQKSKNQMDDEIEEVKQKTKQLQKELVVSQKKIDQMQYEFESKLAETEARETELRDKIKEKTRIELDLKKKIHNLDKIIKQTHTDSDEMDNKHQNLEKGYNASLIQNTVLREKVNCLEEELSRFTSLEEDFSNVKTQQSQSFTEMEILKEKLSGHETVKSEYHALSQENTELKVKIQNLESALSMHQKLESDHKQLITIQHENESKIEILDKRSIEFENLKEAHNKLVVIHEDSESKLKHVKVMLGEFEELKQKYTEILQINQNLEGSMMKMVSREEQLDILQQLDESQIKVKCLEREVADIADKTLSEERTKSSIQLKTLESKLDQFLTLEDEYKSLLKIHHAANETISELEGELTEVESKSSKVISCSTQTDNLSDVSFESAVFSESSDNDSPTHRPKINKTEDRTSFMFKEGLSQTKHSLSMSSRPFQGETLMSNSSATSAKKTSYILSKPKTIHQASGRYSLNSITEDNKNKDLENQVSKLEGENSRLRDEIRNKIDVVQTLEKELEQTARRLNSIGSTTRVLKISRTEDTVDMGRNNQQLASQRCSGDHQTLETKITQLQDEGQLFREKISNLENSNKQLQEQLKDNSNGTHRKSSSPEGERFKSNFLKNKIKFFESGQTEKSDDMLDKPEDLLRQQIADMEVLRQQVTDLENDRDKLHDNSRRDKQIIHNQHITISELQFSEKVLREQVSTLTQSERDLYDKCSRLEDQVTKQEDEVHELQICEKHLQELIRKLKLNEEALVAKNENMVCNMAELTSSSAEFKTKINDLANENSKLSDKTLYFELKVKDLESSEMVLIQKVKHYENMESNLESKLKDLENCKVAANSQARELDVVSTDLEQKLDQAMDENNMLSRHVTELRTQMQEIDRQLLKSKDSELGLKQHMESLEKSELVLQKRIKELELRNIDIRANNRELSQKVTILQDRNGTLQTEHNLKYKIQQLGNSQVPPKSKQEKLPDRIEDCHQRILQLQNVVAYLQKSVDENGNHANKEVENRDLWEEADKQMQDLEKLNHHLNSLMEEKKNGKEISRPEVDIAKLNRRLESYQDFLYRLKQNLQGMRGSSIDHPDTDFVQDVIPGDQSRGNKRVMQTVRGLTTQPEELTLEGGYIIPLENSQRQSDDKRSDVKAHEELIKRDTSGVYSTPPRKSSSQEVKQRLISKNKVGHSELISESSVIEGHKNYAKSAQPATVDDIQVSNGWKSVAKATSLSQPHQGKGNEELVIGLTLPSESEFANDTDSAMSSPEVPRAHKNASKTGSSDTLAPPLPKTLPPALPVKTVFAQDSYYLPSVHTSAIMNSDGELDNVVSPSRGRDMPSPEVSKAQVNDDSVFVSTTMLNLTGKPQPRTLSALNNRTDSGQAANTSNMGQIQNLVDKIGHIEQQLQATNEETETEDENVFDWKVQANDKTQQLEITSSENRLLKNEHPPAVRRRKKINRLEKELEEKNRYCSTLDKWLRSFDDIFKNKDIKCDRDILQQLQSDLVRVKGELSNSGQRKEDLSQDPAALQTELNMKNRELSTKRQEVETLLKEIRCWQDECRSIESMRTNALDSLRALEMEAMELQDVHKELNDLKDEYSSLRGQLADVREKCKDFNVVSEENQDLEEQVEKLRQRLHDLGFVEAENSSLGGQLEGATKILNERMDKVRELTEETIKLNDKVRDLENQKESFQSVKEEYDNLRARYDEIEISKQKALSDVAPLKAKVARLSQKCQEKNSLIRRLANEMESKGGKSALLDELRMLEVAMTDESDIEGPVPVSPARSPRRMPPHLQPRRSPVYGQGRTSPGYMSSSSSFSDGRDLLSDTELISAPSTNLPQRPRSAEQASRPSHLRRRQLPRSDFQTPSNNPNIKATSEDPQLFLAISDFNPQFFSKSDKPWLELPLREGDRVKVMGQRNGSGYYEAEVNNRVGLVPASYLQPLHHSPEWYHSSLNIKTTPILQSTPRNQEGSPEKIVNMFKQLNTVQPSPIHGSHFKPINNIHQTTQTKGEGQSTSTTQTTSPTHRPPLLSGAPDPPRKLKASKIVGVNNVVVSWITPELTDGHCSHGSPVTGYRIFCNGKICHQSHSPLLSKAVIENVLMDQPIKFSIQTIAANGLVSTSVSTMFNGSASAPPSDIDSDQESDADLSSIFSKVHQDQGERRQFIGIYDYNPRHHSPQDMTGQELTFQTGDLIAVFGQQRPDGLYHAEINGKRGLVPARFIEQIHSSPSQNFKANKIPPSPAPRFRSTASLNSPASKSQLTPLPQTYL